MYFTLKQTKTTPYISFSEGYLLIMGNSFPTNGLDLYRNLNQCLIDYCKHPLQKTLVKIDMNLINCFTKRFILDAFRNLAKIKDTQNTIEVNWFYEETDDDMLELGVLMQSLIALPFKFIPKTDRKK